MAPVIRSADTNSLELKEIFNETFSAFARILKETTMTAPNKASFTISRAERSSVPRFIGPMGDTQATLEHIFKLSRFFRSLSLTLPSDNDELNEERRRSIIEIANDSVECVEMRTWIKREGRAMEQDGETSWEEWSTAFREKTLPFRWEMDEKRKLGRLRMRTAGDWRAFDSASVAHRQNLIGTNLYPSDRETIEHYIVGLPETLYRKVKRHPMLFQGNLDEIRRLIGEHVEVWREEET
nr:hypothetical protein L203_04188 [Cryptococcus depauperatus CBS 7841]